MTRPPRRAVPAKIEPSGEQPGAAALVPSGSEYGDSIANRFTRYHAKLVKSLVARTRSWEEACYIASQAFLEVLAQRPGTVSFLGPYLYRTARNRAMNRLTHEAMRKRKESIVGYEPGSQP